MRRGKVALRVSDRDKKSHCLAFPWQDSNGILHIPPWAWVKEQSSFPDNVPAIFSLKWTQGATFTRCIMNRAVEIILKES